MKLLLTGAPRCGKSTVVRRLVEAYSGVAGGLMTAELLGPDGKRCGLELQAIWREPGGPIRVVTRAVLAHEESGSPLRVGRYGVESAALDLAVRVLDAAMHEQGLIIVDEIGPMQLLSSQFQDAILRCLDSTCSLVGVLGEAPAPFVQAIRIRPGVRILEVTRANRRSLTEGLAPWMREA